jgi:hypothetical protein
MRHTTILIGVVLALAGCKTGGPASGSADAEESKRAPDIRSCAASFEESESLSTHVESCRYLWVEPGCRQAWKEALHNPPGNRGEYVIQKCASAYCPELPSPRPALCTRDDLAGADLLDEEPDWLELWTRFNGVVLNRDLELEPDDQAGAMIARRLLQQVAISTEPASDG